MNTSRRRFLQASAGAVAMSAMAGCLGDDDLDGYSAFFTLDDWVNEIVGDELAFDEPVGTGRMGHGWSPDGDIVTDIAATDMFIYLDIQEFSWAQDIVSTLEQDYDDMHIVDALDGLEPFLIPFDADVEGSEGVPRPEYGHDFDQAEIQFDSFEIWDRRSDEQLGYWHIEHWHGGLPDVPSDSFVPVGIVLRDADERVVPLGDDQQYRVDARIADGAPEDVLSIETHGDTVEFHGESIGETSVIFEFYSNGELLYESTNGPAQVAVVDEPIDQDFFDPHIWVDPVYSQHMIETITDAIVEYDPDNESTYRENAAEYTDRLDDIDEQLDAVISEAELGTAVFAGHDSFRYLERRYGFDLVTPVGVTPDAAESLDDIAGLVEVIDDLGIDTVLYDPFEAPDPGDSLPQAVDLIIEDTEVTGAEPLTPLEGLTEDWADNGWGWVEQMENVNIPSLEAALNLD